MTQWLINLFSGAKNTDNEIRNIFFDLVKKNQGSITVMEFAMAANLSGTDAKKILEKFAVEFDATFEVTEEGHILYLFPFREQSIAEKNTPQSLTNSVIPPQKTETTKQKQETIANDFKEDIKNNKSQQNNESPEENKDSQYDYIYQDIKKKVEDVKKVENDLKKFSKSINDLFRF